MTATERDSLPAPTPGVVAGIWKFDMEKVSHADLCELALEWRLREHSSYENLHVRQCSSKQWGLSFQVTLYNTSSKQFFSEMTDKLKRRFGNDFAGWDFSHEVWSIPTK